MNKKKKSTNTSPYPDEAIKRLARAFYPAILACWNSEEGQRSLVGVRPLHLACARPFGRLKAPLGLLLLRCAAQTRACRVAGGTGSHLRQRKTERSRWGTPCQPYRLWIFAGCVRQGAPCSCFIRICLRTILLANHPLQHAASGSRPPHGSEPDAENVRLIPAFCAKMPCRHAGMQCRFLASFPRLFA